MHLTLFVSHARWLCKESSVAAESFAALSLTENGLAPMIAGSDVPYRET